MKIYYDVSDIIEMLDVSQSKAYGIINKLNAELDSKGFLTLSGKVSVAYFNKKWYGLDQIEQAAQGAS